MSSGTNTERITQNNGIISENNVDLEALKTRIQNLPSKTQKVILPNGIKFGNSTSTDFNWLKDADTSNITEMSSMFANCSGITELNADNLITSKVTSIGSMFGSCGNLENISLKNCDTQNVIGLNDLFVNCRKLKSVDLSSFTINPNHSSNYNLHRIFDGCSSLMYIDISNLDFSGSFNYHSNIFRNVPSECLIYVKDQNTVDILTSWDNTHTYTIKQ